MSTIILRTYSKSLFISNVSKICMLLTLNAVASYVNNGSTINALRNASFRKLRFPPRGSFVMIELQIAGNISRRINIHGQISLARRVSR